jgi:hypothetical protein
VCERAGSGEAQRGALVFRVDADGAEVVKTQQGAEYREWITLLGGECLAVSDERGVSVVPCRGHGGRAVGGGRESESLVPDVAVYWAAFAWQFGDQPLVAVICAGCECDGEVG